MTGTRKLGRRTSSRIAMLRSMVTFLLENGTMKTTITRAKEIKAIAERMITLGRKNDLATKRQVMKFITKEDVTKKIFDELAPKYAEKNGGYVKINKLGQRRGDAAEMAIVRLI